ncbi:Mechanosensitive ion channel-domain-containing protein [Gautieria morchelliformis]|nr:Mechanosensitive ion channel-domain-containing protein [Gautieria morchelliformis]
MEEQLTPHTESSMKPTTGNAALLKAIDYADTSHLSPLHDLHEVKVQHEDSQTSLSDTATNSSDEFWDDAAKEAGVLKPLDEARAKRGRRLYLAFMRLYRPIRVLFVAVLGASILITPFLIFRFSFPHSVARPHVVAWSIWFTITWACGAAISILIDIMPRILLSLILNVFGKPPESLMTQLELFMAVSLWLKIAADVAACWITLSVTRGVLNPPGSYWIYVNRAVSVLFAASMILLAEKVLLQFVAIRFHRRALADRLSENKLALKALDRLSNAQPTSAKRFTYGRKKGHSHKSPSTSVPASRSTSYDALSTLATSVGISSSSSTHEQSHPVEVTEKEHHRSHLHDHAKAKDKRRRRKAMTSVILDQLGDAIGAVALKNSKFNQEFGSLHSARKLARKLFATLSDVHPPRNLIMSDFYPYFPTHHEAEAAFQLIDKDGNGDIERREMREAVQRIYRERKALTASLKDVSNAVAKLDGVLLFVALLLIAFVALLVFDRTNTLTSLVPLATVVLGFSFIFGHSAQTLFESLIFIFSTHVFDVGDLVLIDDQALLVREFGLLSTTFRRVDGQEIIAPNAVLANNKLIHNLRRSSSMWESTVLNIGYDTPLETVERLRIRLKAYVQANNREWLDCTVNVDKMEFQNAIFLTIGMQHKSNWQDWGARWERRTAFMRHMKTVLEELEIGYSLPLQPVVLHPSSALSALRASQSVGSRASPNAATLGNAGGFVGAQRAAAPGPTLRADDH